MTTEVIGARAEMLIRRPVAEVFAAFVDPERTSKFWFTNGSERLAAGKQVHWDWEMYGFSVPVDVKIVEDNRRIVVEWPTYGAPTTIEWLFDARADGSTFVTITNSGFSGCKRRDRAASSHCNGGFRVRVGRSEGVARARRGTEPGCRPPARRTPCFGLLKSQ